MRKPSLKPSNLSREELLERRVSDLERMLRRMPVRSVSSGADQTATVVNQTAHALAVGNVIRHNGTSWVKSQADTAANAIVGSIVIAVLSPDVFVLATAGYVAGLSGLTAGAVHYLDSATAGALTLTQTRSAVILADSETSGVLLMTGIVPPFPVTGALFASSGTWTVPDGVTRVTSIIVGGGGGGGGGRRDAATYTVTSGGAVSDQLFTIRYGAGGGAGGMMQVTFDTVPGENISYSVGGGGAGGTGANYGISGGASSITLDTVVFAAQGGEGGPWYNGNTGGIYGRGGAPVPPVYTGGRNVLTCCSPGGNGAHVLDVVSFFNSPTGQANAQPGGRYWSVQVGNTRAVGGEGGNGSRDVSAAGGAGSIGFVFFTW
jgi:hypothetical protein